MTDLRIGAASVAHDRAARRPAPAEAAHFQSSLLSARRDQRADAGSSSPAHESLTSGLLLRVASNGDGKPPPKAPVVTGPDGKQIYPPPKEPPQQGRPQTQVPEPTPPPQRKPDLEFACAAIYERCQKGCRKIPPLPRGIGAVLRGVCQTYCAAQYALCRFSGNLSQGGQ